MVVIDASRVFELSLGIVVLIALAAPSTAFSQRAAELQRQIDEADRQLLADLYETDQRFCRRRLYTLQTLLNALPCGRSRGMCV